MRRVQHAVALPLLEMALASLQHTACSGLRAGSATCGAFLHVQYADGLLLLFPVSFLSLWVAKFIIYSIAIFLEKWFSNLALSERGV